MDQPKPEDPPKQIEEAPTPKPVDPLPPQPAPESKPKPKPLVKGEDLYVQEGPILVVDQKWIMGPNAHNDLLTRSSSLAPKSSVWRFQEILLRQLVPHEVSIHALIDQEKDKMRPGSSVKLEDLHTTALTCEYYDRTYTSEGARKVREYLRANLHKVLNDFIEEKAKYVNENMLNRAILKCLASRPVINPFDFGVAVSMNLVDKSVRSMKAYKANADETARRMPGNKLYFNILPPLHAAPLDLSDDPAKKQYLQKSYEVIANCELMHQSLEKLAAMQAYSVKILAEAEALVQEEEEAKNNAEKRNDATAKDAMAMGLGTTLVKDATAAYEKLLCKLETYRKRWESEKETRDTVIAKNKELENILFDDQKYTPVASPAPYTSPPHLSAYVEVSIADLMRGVIHLGSKNEAARVHYTKANPRANSETDPLLLPSQREWAVQQNIITANFWAAVRKLDKEISTMYIPDPTVQYVMIPEKLAIANFIRTVSSRITAASPYKVVYTGDGPVDEAFVIIELAALEYAAAMCVTYAVRSKPTEDIKDFEFHIAYLANPVHDKMSGGRFKKIPKLEAAKNKDFRWKDARGIHIGEEKFTEKKTLVHEALINFCFLEPFPTENELEIAECHMIAEPETSPFKTLDDFIRFKRDYCILYRCPPGASLEYEARTFINFTHPTHKALAAEQTTQLKEFQDKHDKQRIAAKIPKSVESLELAGSLNQAADSLENEANEAIERAKESHTNPLEAIGRLFDPAPPVSNTDTTTVPNGTAPPKQRTVRPPEATSAFFAFDDLLEEERKIRQPFSQGPPVESKEP